MFLYRAQSSPALPFRCLLIVRPDVTVHWVAVMMLRFRSLISDRILVILRILVVL